MKNEPGTMMIVSKNTFLTNWTMMSAVRFYTLTNKTITNTWNQKFFFSISKKGKRTYCHRNVELIKANLLVEQDELIPHVFRRLSVHLRYVRLRHRQCKTSISNSIFNFTFKSVSFTCSGGVRDLSKIVR